MPDFTRDEWDDKVVPVHGLTPKPSVGERVRLTVWDWYSACIHKNSTWRVIGDVIHMPCADVADAFALWVNDDMVPLRVIRLRHVLSINGVRVVHPYSQPREPVVARAQSFYIENSKGTDKYLVETFGGSWTCTCKGFGFRHQCRHIIEAQARIASQQAA